MKTFFTADTHLGHKNIIKYCNRPFVNEVEMNNALINNWNSVVSDGDIVYHLGDFCFGRESYHFDAFREQLKGCIIFIKGNHDRLAWANRSKFYASHDTYHEIQVEGKDITLCHYAMKVWNKSHYGSWHLFGHSHGSLPDDPHSLSLDVGVDCHNFTPISFEQVKVLMDKKLWKPIDHHGKRQENGGIGLNREDYARLERRKMYEQLKKEFEPHLFGIKGLESDVDNTDSDLDKALLEHCKTYCGPTTSKSDVFMVI